MPSRVVLGGVLVFAGVMKLPHTGTLIWEIGQYQLLPDSLATVFGSVLPALEVVLGLLLIVGVVTRIGAFGGGSLLLGFAIAKVAAIARGLEIDVCPCFGPAVPLLGIHSLVLDFMLLAPAVHLVLRGGGPLSLDWLYRMGRGSNGSR